MDTHLKRLGFEAGDLGSHSCRKVLDTMVAAGCTASPPIVELCIQEGWILGGVKDKYLFREKAGVKYIRICASFLDQLKKESAVTPPYFDFTELCDIEKLYHKRQLCQFVDIRLPIYNYISAKINHLSMC